MSLFEPFKKATRPETPRFMNAEIQQGNFANAAKQQENALRSQNMLGAATIYNEATPDTTPIGDYLFGSGAETEAAPMLAGETMAAESLVPAGTAITGGVPGAATTAAGTAAEAGLAGMPAVAGAAAPAAASGAAAGGTGALAAMGPAGWAAMAAMALGILG